MIFKRLSAFDFPIDNLRNESHQSHEKFRQSPNNDRLGHFTRTFCDRAGCTVRPGAYRRYRRNVVLDHRVRLVAACLPRPGALGVV